MLCLGSSIFLILLSILFSSFFLPYRYFAYLLWFPASCLYGILKCANEQVSVFCAFSWILSLGLFCQIPMSWLSLYIIILFLSSHRSPCFLMRDRKVVGPNRRGGEEELGVMERKETIIRIYCVRKKYIFYKRRKRWKIFHAHFGTSTMLFYCPYSLEMRNVVISKTLKFHIF